MKFGVREIANVVFKAKNTQKIGPYTFRPGQPVFYMDSAKTSTLEGAATTVYAQGGRGNTRLVTWEGEKTLTFTVEDALLSPVSFAMLSGAGLLKGTDEEKIHFHQTTATVIDVVGSQATIDLSEAIDTGEEICETAPIFIVAIDKDGDLKGMLKTTSWAVAAKSGETKKTQLVTSTFNADDNDSTTVVVDYYVLKNASTVSELQIDAENFAGNYYVEADTLFRRQNDGKDLPANITLPNVKIQSNFTFTMASTGDPSTFTFTMDAMPGYTYFDRTKKVLCAIQIVDDADDEIKTPKTIFPHPTGFDIEESATYDSIPGAHNETESTGAPKLSIDASGGYVTVLRKHGEDFNEQIYPGTILAADEILKITATPYDNEDTLNITVNDAEFTSGNTHTVAGNVVIVATVTTG